MSQGLREVAGDVFGGSSSLTDITIDNFGVVSKRRKRRRKSSKSHRKLSHKRIKRHRARSHRRKSKKIRNVRNRKHSKRRGMSREFLRELRRKHGLGEFKK